VKEHTCLIVSKEELVAHADGDLPPSEAERIAEHIAACPVCQAVIEALERSLQVTQAIWQTAQARWPETPSFDKVRSNKWPHRKAMRVAAGVLSIVAVGAAWQLLPESSDHRRTVSEEAKVIELKLKIADSADAARLLAAAELLSKYPEAKSGIRQRYQHIVETYPETAAAAKARLKIQ